MNAIKRVMSMILVLVMVLSMMPINTQAEEIPQTSIDSSDITIEGTNGFGTLLSNEIAQYQSDMENSDGYPGGYTVTDLEISSNQATVTYDSMEEAQLVVALYTEDGVQLLTSATVTVSPEETQAVLTIPGTMPQYFMASAYLLDSYDYSPLCPAYDTPMYTQEMQELLASTVDDYDTDRVLNLDEDNTTNFAVYADDTIIIEPASGVNTVSGMDDESDTYIITNADAQFTSLQPGNVFAYPYAENELLIVKVAAIQVEGTTVTITGEDLEMEEAFSHVKVEAADNSDGLIFEEGSAGDGVTYLGMEEAVPEDEVATFGLARGLDASLSATLTHKFAFSKYVEEKNNGIDTLTLSIEGTIQFSATAKLTYYISTSKQYLQFRTDASLEMSVSASGKLESPLLKLGSLGFAIVPGVYVGFEPQIMFKMSASVKTGITISTTVGFSYEKGKGFQNLCTSPTTKYTTEIEGSMSISFDLCPKISILNDVAAAGMTAEVGIALNGRMTGMDYDNFDSTWDKQPSHHMCQKCLSCEIKANLSVGAWVEFLKWDKLRFSVTFMNIELDIGEFYYSFDQKDGDFGSCPNIEYRLTICVEDEQGTAIEGAEILTSKDESWGVTNKNGVLIKYVPEGFYRIHTTIQDQRVESTSLVTESAKVAIKPEKESNSISSIIHFDFLSLIDGSPTASGTCGDNLDCKLYANGLLQIYGYGPMHDFDSDEIIWGGGDDRPWADEYKSITRVVVSDGVTTIGVAAFCGCSNLTSVTIPNSITTIGKDAFYWCDNLTDVYYSGTKAQWDQIYIGTCNEELTSATIHFNGTGPVAANVLMDPTSGDTFQVSDGSENEQAQNAVFGGEYGTEVNADRTLKTATFTDLVPGGQYVLLALVDIEVDNLLSPDNLLYIDQTSAREDGTIAFSYAQRVTKDISYVMACGPSNNDLADATIVFPEMFSDGEIHLADPVVTYDGKVLTENQDYVILGAVDYTKPGTYICYIRGIYNYSGLVECQYTVLETTEEPTITLKYPTLSFESEVFYNVYFTASDVTSVEEMGLLTWYTRPASQAAATYENAEAVISGAVHNSTSGTYMARSKGVPAKQLGDNMYIRVYAKLTDGTYAYSPVTYYNAKMYASDILANSQSAEMKSLVVAMLNYGAAAQVHFNHNADNLMNAGLTAEQKALVKAYSSDMIGAVISADADKVGTFKSNGGFSGGYPSVSFEGAFAINFYLTPKQTVEGDITLYCWDLATYNSVSTLTEENATAKITMTKGGTQYVGSYAGIAAKQIDETVFVAGVYTSGGVRYSSPVISYSLGAYCKDQIANGSETMQEFAKETAVYGHYAENYFANLNG